ncbi:ribosomal oxygenase 1 [Orussus abietinus]|uniref:ribosomal oxygenase 1 n=1 Tax=Orussus abietinus TaxID=222816 RepID=UPI0006265B40|nr:ribosomal oxygenase 1 [Orussus abietinus]
MNDGEQVSAFSVYSQKRKCSVDRSKAKKVKSNTQNSKRDCATVKDNNKKRVKFLTKSKPPKSKSFSPANETLSSSFVYIDKECIPPSSQKADKPIGKIKNKFNLKSNLLKLTNKKSKKNLQNSRAVVLYKPKGQNKISKKIGGMHDFIMKRGEKKYKIKHIEQKEDISIVNAKKPNKEADPIIDSVEQGKKLFQWLIHPLDVSDFFKNNWESAPLHIKRNAPKYYGNIMSTQLLDKILRDEHILFTKNLDITSYSNGIRETHNPPGRAFASIVWDYYLNDCSVRMLNPQTFIPKLHMLNATLQEFFGCFVGANSYLTPPGSQGFAPHYDDIEAFILQIEGKKRWRLYKPPSAYEFLARDSSKNFDQSEIGEPILDTIVNAGDLLYFPRGTIHQGETVEGTHSLHITLSVYQRNSWGDFLEKLIPEALKCAINSNIEYREGLPLNYLQHIGLVHTEDQSEDRKKIIEKTKELLKNLIKHIDIDKAADEMAKRHIHDFLPPVPTSEELVCSIHDGGEIMSNGKVVNRVEIEPTTKIRLLRAHCIRLVKEEDVFKVYYSCENSKEYHEFEPQFLEVSKELAPAVKRIIKHYPEYITVEDLPIEGEDNKIQVARDLWERGIVVTDLPLPEME